MMLLYTTPSNQTVELHCDMDGYKILGIEAFLPGEDGDLWETFPKAEQWRMFQFAEGYWRDSLTDFADE